MASYSRALQLKKFKNSSKGLFGNNERVIFDQLMEGRLKLPNKTTDELTFVKVSKQVGRCFIHSKSATRRPDNGGEL